MYSSEYSAAFSSPDDFCAWYYGLDGAYEVAEHVLSLSERAITEKLLLYYIARAENIIPTDDAALVAYEKALDEHFLYYIEGTETEAEINSLSGEEREKKIAEIKNELLLYFGEEYFTYIAFYEICFDAMLEWAVIG